MTADTDARAREIADRVAKATEGPWESDYVMCEDGNGSYRDFAILDDKGRLVVATLWGDHAEIHEEWGDDHCGGHCWDETANRNSNFIAYARTDVPWLLSQREADEAEIKRLREALETIADANDAGRHDGLPEPCPVYDADTMFAIARNALGWANPKAKGKS